MSTAITSPPEARSPRDRRWRYLVMPPQPGAHNMAWDEALARCCQAGASPPTLRLYRWQPWCVSLGYFQSLSASVDLDACRHRGIEWVRRPTGGRALLHADELTYAAIVPLTFWPGEATIARTYRDLCLAFVESLRALGRQADFGREPSPSPRSPGGDAFCFHASTRADLSVEGRKLVGSAQRRWQGVLLQHGSLPFRRNPEQVARLIRGPHRTGRWTTTAELGLDTDFAAWSERLRTAWEDTLAIELAPGEPSDEERQSAQRLLATRYSRADWTERVP